MARSRLLRTPPGYVLEAALFLCCVCSSLGQYGQFPFLEGQQGRLDVIEEPLVQPIDPQTGRASRCYDETGKPQVGGGSDTCSIGSLRSVDCQQLGGWCSYKVGEGGIVGKRRAASVTPSPQAVTHELKRGEAGECLRSLVQCSFLNIGWAKIRHDNNHFEFFLNKWHKDYN